MKSFTEFIKEQLEQENMEEILEAAASYKFSYDLSKFEGCDDVVKQLSEIDGVEVEDKTVSFTVSTDDPKDEAMNIIDDFIKTLKSSSKRSSDEQYAQSINKLAKKYEEAKNALVIVDDNEEKEEKCEDKDCDKKEEE